MKFYQVISPVTTILFMVAIYLLSYIDNPLGWQQGAPVTDRYIDVIVLYAVLFLVGCMAVMAVSTKPARTAVYPPAPKNFSNRFRLIFLMAVLFTVLNMYSRGGIALLAGDGLEIRSLSQGLGGYADFPSDLITPLAILGFLTYLRQGQRAFALATLTGLTLQLLQLNRQEALVILAGCIVVYMFDKKVRIGLLLMLGIGGFLLLYLLIGGLQIVRHGAEAISTQIDILILPLWIIHGDLTGSMRMAHTVIDQIGPGGFGGMYSFGVYVSVVVPDFKLHGAEMVRALFTAKQTAQSIGAPLSYYADGGMLLVGVLAVANGMFLTLFWVMARARYSAYWLTLFSIQLLWSFWITRSGGLLISPTTLYQLAAVTFVWFGATRSEKWNVLSLVIGACFISTLPISFLFTLIRLV